LETLRRSTNAIVGGFLIKDNRVNYSQLWPLWRFSVWYRDDPYCGGMSVIWMFARKSWVLRWSHNEA